MSYLYDSDATREELMKYIDECSVRQAGDTKAFLEILRLIDDTDVGAYEALIKIARICEERLKE